jgi:hypothetical protein
MPSSRRSKRIIKKKQALEALGTDPSALDLLLSLAQDDPGRPLRSFIRGHLRKIVAAHPDKPELMVDIREIQDTLLEARLKKEKLLAVRKEEKVPPFPIPAPWAEKFRWVFRLNRLSEVVWRMEQV